MLEPVARAPHGGQDGQREVHSPAFRRASLSFGLGQVQRQLDPRVALAEAGDRQRHERRARGRERADAQTAPAQAGDRLELGLGVGQPREDDVGVRDERPPGVGQADAAGVALDERRARLALERGHLLGHGGLRVGERLRGRGERAAGGDLAQDAQAADVEHQRSLCQASRRFICACPGEPRGSAHVPRPLPPLPLAATPADDTVVVRRAVAADAAGLERLRLLDGAPRALRGTVLVAEAGGVVHAAHAVEDGVTVADPFRATAASRRSCGRAPRSCAARCRRALAPPRACAGAAWRPRRCARRRRPPRPKTWVASRNPTR